MRALIRVILAVVLVTVTMISCVQQESLVKPKAPLKISINVWPGYAHAFLAQEKGFFKKNNVDVELVLKKSTKDSLGLFKNGKVDGCFDIFPDMVMINSQGIPAKVVCAVDYSDTGDVIIGRPEFSALSDLKDKIVSFEGVNTFSHFFVLKSLEKAGLDEADLRFADIDALDVLQALKKGNIDAGHTWEPIKSQALKEGYKILAKAGDIPGIIVDILAFNPDVIRNRPEDIRAVIKSLFEARDYLKSNPEESIKIVARKMGITEEEMAGGLKGVHLVDLPESLRLLTTTTTTTTNVPSLYIIGGLIIDFYINRGQLLTVPNLTDILESKFLNELSDR